MTEKTEDHEGDGPRAEDAWGARPPKAGSRRTATPKPVSEITFRFWTLRPVAFVSALLLTPLAMALLGVVTLPIGVGIVLLASVPLGAPSFFAVFAPLAWLAEIKGVRSAADFANIGFIANFIAFVVLGLGLAIAEAPKAMNDIVAFVHGFGLILAPMYAAMFALLFRRLRQPDDEADLVIPPLSADEDARAPRP